MKTTASSDKSGSVPIAAFASPDQVTALRQILASMDAWLTNDEGLFIEDVVEWRDALAMLLGVEPGSWFENTGR